MAEAKIDIILSNGAKAGNTLKELTKDANRLNKEIKDLQPGSQQFIDKSKDLQQVNGRLKEVKDQIRGTAQASSELKDAFSQFIPFSGTFQSVGQSLGIAQKGVGGLTSSFGALRAAIIATGVGALVVAFTALVTWMKKTDEGADFLEDAMNGVTSHFEVLTSRLNNLKDSFNDLLKNPIKFFKEIVTDTQKAVIENQRYINSLRELEDRQHGIDIATAENEKTVTRLLLQSKNVSLSYRERLEALDEATRLEGANFVKQQQLREETFAAEQRNLAERVKQQNKYVDLEDYTQGEIVRRVLDGSLKKGSITDEEINRFMQAQIAKINGETEFINFQESVANRRAQITEKQTAENERAAEAERKRKEQAAKDEADKLKKEEDAKKIYYANLRNLEDMNLQAMENGREKDIASLELSLRRQLELIDSNAPFYAERVAAAQELARQKRDEVNKKWDFIDLNSQLGALEETSARENLKLLESLSEREISRSEFDQAAYENQVNLYEDQLELLESSGEAETEAYRNIQEKKLQIELDYNERVKQGRLALLQGSVQLGTELLDSDIARLNREMAQREERLEKIREQYGEESIAYKTAQAEIEEVRKSNAERVKKAEKTKVRINLLSEIAGIWMQSSSTYPAPYGQILAGILTAAAIVRANKNMKEIDAQKYAQGGVLSGPGHESGGIPFTIKGKAGFEAEGGEVLINKRSAFKFRRELSEINSYNNWGRKFAVGGPLNPFNSSASASSTSNAPSSSGSLSVPQDMANFQALLMENLQAINSRFDRIKVVNVATETQDAINTVNLIKEEADV